MKVEKNSGDGLQNGVGWGFQRKPPCGHAGQLSGPILKSSKRTNNGVGLISDRSDVPPRVYPGADTFPGEGDRRGFGISIWDMIAKPMRGIWNFMD